MRGLDWAITNSLLSSIGSAALCRYLKGKGAAILGGTCTADREKCPLEWNGRREMKGRDASRISFNAAHGEAWCAARLRPPFGTVRRMPGVTGDARMRSCGSVVLAAGTCVGGSLFFRLGGKRLHRVQGALNPGFAEIGG